MDDIKFSAPEKIEDDKSVDIIVLKFADSKVPVFKEKRGKDYIEYGENNSYPEYLTFLFNKSAKHNAILTGKANYIFGKGYENGNIIINRTNETLNDIAKKAILDIEIYGGCRLEIIWARNGRVSEIYHCDYSTLRKGKDGGFIYKENWDPKAYPKPEEEFINAFNPADPIGSQIFEYNEYRPGVRFYPLPGYIGSNNYIETDIEISKYYLSAIRNGMMPSKMVQFYQGEPTDEKKKEIEKRFGQKFAGSENAGKFILVFNNSKDKQVDISDLSASEVDKQFVELNKTCQQEIFSGHLVTSPMLFGIKTEGQLGGNTELKLAYGIFQNTYAEPKATAFDKEINYVLNYSNFKSVYKLQPTDPIGLQFDIKDVVQSLPKQFILKELGVPEDLWAGETIGGNTATKPFSEATDSAPVNDHIKNLSGRQMQGINRIIRQYDDGNGKLTRAAATALLKTGYGLSDEDVIAFLGEETQPLALSFEDQQDNIIAMFDACGDSKKDFEILKSKRVSFSADEIEEDEKIYINEAFKTYDVTATEDKIIELIKKDGKVTPEVIAKAIGESKSFVESKLKSLAKKGYIESTVEKIGVDEIINRALSKGVDLKPPVSKSPAVQIFIKYSYEGPEDSRNRPFCAKMMELNRLYSRYDIEQISQRLGYSVFDRRGGFWNNSGTVEPHCRHNWKSNIVVKKGGAAS